MMRREEDEEEERAKGKVFVLSLPPALSPYSRREKGPETSGRVQERAGVVPDQQSCYPAQGATFRAVGAILQAPLRRQELLNPRSSGNIWEIE